MTAIANPFGAILAGGQNRRYGAHKALAQVAGQPILSRVMDALGGVLPDLILVANEPEIYAPAGLPMRSDARPGTGALGGVYTALLWAREAGRPGILAVACDMPFLSPALLARLLEVAAPGGAGARAGRVMANGSMPASGAVGLPDVVVPASEGPRGVEPLCAYYSTRCIPAIEAELARGERHIIGFFADVRVATLPLDEVHSFGRAETLFLNVNTPEERERAEVLARESWNG